MRKKEYVGKIGSTSCLRNGLAPALVTTTTGVSGRSIFCWILLTMSRMAGGARAAMLFCSPCSTVPSTDCSTPRSVKYTRSSPVGVRYGFTSVRRMLWRTYSVSRVVFFVVWAASPKSFQDRHAVTNRHAFTEQVLQDLLNARERQQLRNKIFHRLWTILGNPIAERLGVLPRKDLMRIPAYNLGQDAFLVR